MGKFSLKNGLLITYAQLIKHADVQFWFGLIMFFVPGIYGGLIFKHLWFAIIWCIIIFILFVLFRCWDDPYELGWLER